MRKLTLSIVLLTIMASLVACGGNKDNQNETKPTLEVIKPTETTEAETVQDKLDDPVKELEIHGVYAELYITVKMYPCSGGTDTGSPEL